MTDENQLERPIKMKNTGSTNTEPAVQIPTQSTLASAQSLDDGDMAPPASKRRDAKTEAKGKPSKGPGRPRKNAADVEEFDETNFEHTNIEGSTVFGLTKKKL